MNCELGDMTAYLLLVSVDVSVFSQCLPAVCFVRDISCNINISII